MSLILEALRKSEAERRRGEIPGLHAELAPLAPVATAGRPAWLWWAVLIGSVAIVAAVWSWRGRSAAPAAVGSHEPAMATPVDAATAPDVGPSTPAATAPSLASVPDRPSPGGAAAPGSDAAGSLAADAGEPPRAARPAAAVPAPDAPSMDPPGAAPADAADRRGPTPDVAAAPPATTPVRAAAAIPARAAATPAEDGPATGSAPRAVADPVRLADLSVAQRQMLPPLRMSMHMRGPTQRFAIIDGVRLAEGDRIGDAVVEEITGAGVVLDWQGMRLLVPVR